MKGAVRVGFLLLLLAAVAGAVCSLSLNCPIHDGWKANWTGNRMVDGVIVGIYHCPRGHNFIARCD
jgi:hypothetical protein